MSSPEKSFLPPPPPTSPSLSLCFSVLNPPPPPHTPLFQPKTQKLNERQAALKYDSLLVTLISAAGDPNSSASFSSSSSRAALAAAGALARANGSASVTVLLVDEAAPTPEANAPRLEAIAAALQTAGADPASVKFLEKALDAESSHNASVAVGDAADECGADLLILHSDAVHAKRVDANLLAVRHVGVFLAGEERGREKKRTEQTHPLFFARTEKKNRRANRSSSTARCCCSPDSSVFSGRVLLFKERKREKRRERNRRERKRRGRETTLKQKQKQTRF